MNDFVKPNPPLDLPWPRHDAGAPVAATSMLPGSEKAPSATVSMMKSAVEGAHETIDRLAEAAAPAVQQLGEHFSAAAESLKAKAEPLREAGDEWAESARTVVRENPLALVAAALVLGVVIARITR